MDTNKIEKINRSGNFIKLKISSLDEQLIISEETFYQHQLVEGVVITPSQLELLLKESELFRCRREARRLLALRNHSVGELCLKLKRKQFNHDYINEISHQLQKTGLLDDAVYALNLAERLIERKPCGPAYITAYLQKKMINRSLAEETSRQALSGVDMADQALKALQNKWYMYDHLALEDAKKKSYNYLSRRGFTFEASRHAFETLTLEKNKENDH